MIRKYNGASYCYCKQAVLAWTLIQVILFHTVSSQTDLETFVWTEITTKAKWKRRAGLGVVELDGKFFLTGGRTPKQSAYLCFLPFPVPLNKIWGDVWVSEDRGLSWKEIYKWHHKRWSSRAFHQVVTLGEYMYVLGGQNFKLILQSDFFNDVWRSKDGKKWEELTSNAGWRGRAGHSAIVLNDEIYVFAGSENDDEAVIGGPPTRIYFNDVWKSCDGKIWTQLDDAPWEKRAGARQTVKDGYIYMFGGENGFTCSPVPCEPPYFNDVWRFNGTVWEEVTPNAAWSGRPGHEVVVVDDKFVLFGGFGQSQDPNDEFKPSNPVDVWTSNDGKNWTLLEDGPWNAMFPEDVKYDFAALTLGKGNGTTVYTFGGDRETFDFCDYKNYKKVDNDVWTFSLPLS